MQDIEEKQPAAKLEPRLNEITLILINIFILFPNMKTKYTFMISIGLLGEREKQENRQFKFSQNRE